MCGGERPRPAAPRHALTRFPAGGAGERESECERGLSRTACPPHPPAPSLLSAPAPFPLAPPPHTSHLSLSPSPSPLCPSLSLSQIEIAGSRFAYASGANIARFPAGGALHSFRLKDEADSGVARALPAPGSPSASHNRAGRHAILGLTPSGSGRLGLFGDSGCLDSSHQRGDCLALLGRVLAFVAGGQRDDELFAPAALLDAPYTIVGGVPAGGGGMPPPQH